MIKLKNVSFAYSKDSANILKNINLEINDGKCVAFIGASGCGKTTLTRLINGLAYKFYGGKLKGEISIDGINPLEKELYEIGRKVGSIFQNPKSQFFAENVEDEIAFGLENYGIEREKIDKIINNSLKSINGENLKDKNLFHLSSGERQKIAIASINALNPPIYVFDEPSANLDMKSVEALRKLMLLLKKNKKTIIISEHRLYYLRGIVDKYYYLENGEISNVFTEEELLSKSEDFFNKLGLRFFSLNKISPKINKLKEINSMNLEKISFSYNKNVLIKDLTYEFKSGNIYGIIGDNGIGKSTLAKLIAGYWDINTGSIKIGGYNLQEIPLKRLYSLVAFVSQDNFLFNESIRENIRMGNPSASDKEVENIAKKSGCHDFIMNMEKGYDTVVGSSGRQISGGERQRISISRAMLKNSPIVILDEATSYIDPENEVIIKEALSKLIQNKTVIVIAHRLSTITDVQQIFFVENGELISHGKHNELMEDCELYKKMWNAHIGVKDGEIKC